MSIGDKIDAVIAAEAQVAAARSLEQQQTVANASYRTAKNWPHIRPLRRFFYQHIQTTTYDQY